MQVYIAMDSWIKTAAAANIQITGFKTALIVGSILNLINQGDTIFGANWDQVSWPKLLLTYGVPYCVAVFAGTHAIRKQHEI